MSKETTKANTLEKAHEWITAHADEALDLKALKAAITATEKANAATVDAATKLGLALEARKVSHKSLKDALKAAKAARKAPKAPVAPKAPGKKVPAKTGTTKAGSVTAK